MSDVSAFAHEFDRHRLLMESAMEGLTDEQFFARPQEHVNSVAIIVKHLAGNLNSRWSEFLTTDGEKPTRNRDREFVLDEHDSRARLMEDWRRAWATVNSTLRELQDEDLEQTITIRGEPHSAFQALLRGVNHAAWHTGQILYLARLLCPQGRWLTISPGQSTQRRPGYLKPSQT